jgi:flagellar biosynthesis anti-sigma factor FlgM
LIHRSRSAYVDPNYRELQGKDCGEYADKKSVNLPRCGESMRIHSNKPPAGQAPSWTAQNNRRISGMGTQEKDKKSSSTDKVDNLEISRERTDIMVSTNQLLEVREARLQAIKESITAGTYIVYPCKIAEKMLKWI